MSRITNKALEEVVDLFREHSLHETYEPKCSTCFEENSIIKSNVPCIICKTGKRMIGALCRECWLDAENIHD